jgi:hypothetical protein
MMHMTFLRKPQAAIALAKTEHGTTSISALSIELDLRVRNPMSDEVRCALYNPAPKSIAATPF